MKKAILIISLFAFLTSNIQAQRHVHPLPLDSGKSIKGTTFCYMLPTTAFKVTVTVAPIRELKGYYAEHAESLLGLNNVITENKAYYKLRNVEIEPVDVPDQTQTFLVQPSSKQLKAGLLTTLSQETFAPTIGDSLQCYTSKTTPIPNFFKNYADITFTEQEDAFVETKIIDGVVTQVTSNRTKMVSKTNTQKAQEAADAISKSRKAQYALVAGENETPYSSETINAMLQELKNWENNYLSLFQGLVLEDEVTYTFIVTPGTMSKIPLFRFSSANGISFDNLSIGNANCYSLYVEPVFNTTNTTQTLDECQVPMKTRSMGYRYRTAVPMKISLMQQNVEIHDFGTHKMYQHGRIQALPLHQDNIDVHTIGFIF